jgi:hypothetical protein
MAFELEINSIDSADVPLEVQEDWPDPFPSWLPAELDNFGLQLTISIGPKDENSENCFQYYICTRKFKNEMTYDERRNLRSSKFRIVEFYDWDILKRIISDAVKSCEGVNWEASLEMLRKKFKWEFENFKMPSPRSLH